MVSHLRDFKDPMLTMILCAPNDKENEGSLGQKGLSDDTEVDFGDMRFMVTNESLTN